MRHWIALSLLGLLPWTANAVDLRARSTSISKQFTVYCDDPVIRSRVVSAVDVFKSQTLSLLKYPDRWKLPIVVTIEPGEAKVPATVRLMQTADGPTIQVYAKVGANPAAVHLQRHIIQAVMLDYMYRERPAPAVGTAYAEAPWWFVCGVIEHERRKDQCVDSGFFRHLVQTNKLPPVERFLGGHGLELGETAAAFDSACALVFVEMLIEQPEGRARLATLMREWPDVSDPIKALTKAFPGLGEGTDGLQKWWTLSLARFSASDRYLGLSAVDTDRELNKLLEFPVAIDKAGRMERFAVGQFAEYLKKPGAKAALANQRNAVVALSARANALFRPVLVGYEEIFALLLKGRTKEIPAKLHQVELYRTTVLHRMTDITDYLNWFEATQMGGSTKPFESYLRTAKEIDEQPQQTAIGKAISDYLDLLEEQVSVP